MIQGLPFAGGTNGTISAASSSLQAGNDRLADLNINIINIIFYKKLPALGGHDDTIFTRERCRHHADPEDDRGKILFGDPNADDINASPLHLHRFQKGADLGTQVTFPDLPECGVIARAELLEACLRVSG